VQRSDVVVCHAGFGTVMDALTAGVPMVLTPMTADQPDNAERCEAMGVAEVLSYQDVDAVELRSAIDRVLSDDRYRLAAQRAGAEIEAMPGPPEAVVLLETLG
jgi:UDP:flavonoid glycosyltransferase YjiC (YdhE family)